jgi:hypothetical protein
MGHSVKFSINGLNKSCWTTINFTWIEVSNEQAALAYSLLRKIFLSTCADGWIGARMEYMESIWY